ncbi:MAG: hypothetical protein LBO70_02430 [Clostridiales Family XIII bacterium]|jgi:hypothetical protein|nr:hypothetical protein [Clostridiales Family XIII bacterium]
MFKVVKPEYTNKTFRMPTELVKELGQTAHDMGVSMNNLVVQCCEYAIGNLANANYEKQHDAVANDAQPANPLKKGE